MHTGEVADEIGQCMRSRGLTQVDTNSSAVGDAVRVSVHTAPILEKTPQVTNRAMMEKEFAL